MDENRYRRQRRDRDRRDARRTSARPTPPEVASRPCLSCEGGSVWVPLKAGEEERWNSRLAKRQLPDGSWEGQSRCEQCGGTGIDLPLDDRQRVMRSWDYYAQLCLPDGVGPEQYSATRNAFFGGALAMFSFLTGPITDLPEAEAFQILDAVRGEFEDFAAGIQGDDQQ